MQFGNRLRKPMTCTVVLATYLVDALQRLSDFLPTLYSCSRTTRLYGFVLMSRIGDKAALSSREIEGMERESDLAENESKTYFHTRLDGMELCLFCPNATVTIN